MLVGYVFKPFDFRESEFSKRAELLSLILKHLNYSVEAFFHLTPRMIAANKFHIEFGMLAEGIEFPRMEVCGHVSVVRYRPA